ncbi:glycosyl transferase [Lentisphaera araneosa HTCC2155]|jgi:glycosyltransferase involved in cell wall biosynthesis|uniref:Glycosyl transferase n=1 Tax=Lentisphaera araneosa HTCC2155 TaxID=313628 RepID=A6DL33_9BACT|nr:glycosyltransferase [Lentisphaera araneosa]EDM27635.1 glycosyl transferase [Lentisphaera araneosa HTCC2155]
MGLAAARNKGAKIAQGEYLLFLDADDELGKDVLTRALELLPNNENFGLICFRHESIFVDRFPKKSSKVQFSVTREKNFKAFILNKLAIIPSATMIKADVFQKTQFVKELKLSEDIPFFAQVIANYDCLYFDLVLTKMYKHSASMRHDLDRLLSSSYESVDVLFDEKVLPANLFKYRDMYKAKRALSMFRSLRRQGEVEKAKAYYREAIKLHPAFLLNWVYLKKYLLTKKW